MLRHMAVLTVHHAVRYDSLFLSFYRRIACSCNAFEVSMTNKCIKWIFLRVLETVHQIKMFKFSCIMGLTARVAYVRIINPISVVTRATAPPAVRLIAEWRRGLRGKQCCTVCFIVPSGLYLIALSSCTVASFVPFPGPTDSPWHWLCEVWKKKEKKLR